MDQLNPTVGLVVRATPDLSVFGNFATSLSTPTTVQLNNSAAGTGGINSDLEPQTGRTGEIGLRGQAGSTFSYEMSGFVSKLKNELIQFQDGNGRDFYDNAGKSTYQGIETSVRAALPEGIFGQLSYTFMDAKFDEYMEGGNDYSGNFVPGVARHRIAGLVRYSRGFWYAEVRGDHVGKTYTNDANDPNTNVKSYTLWDLRAGLSGQRLGNGGTEVAPFVSLTNVFDAVYSSGYTPNAFGPPGGKRYYEPGPRRAFSAGLTVTFQ
jgi:iron complex outermembrane receptor protein